jgi:N6-L-threonylcarbamoyladenine synthase
VELDLRGDSVPITDNFAIQAAFPPSRENPGGGKPAGRIGFACGVTCLVAQGCRAGVLVDVLGIETSCDETAAAVVDAGGVRSDVVHSQGVHARYGGVVPELASRAHVEKVTAVVRAALDGAGLVRPEAVAATAGPGLIGAVLVGLSFAKGLAAAWDVPFVGVNHLEGHLLSPLLESPAPKWPFLALVVSGGHTTLYLSHGLGVYEVLGETRDDAAGEAFDKVARLLGLGYPGGPVVDRLAATGDAAAVEFPRPLPGDSDFSFSGLKTAVRTYLHRGGSAAEADVCASFQAAVVDCLLDRVVRAAERFGVRRVALAGGVAANSELRRRARALSLDVFLPPVFRCTDNGAMIANAGRLHLLAGDRHDLDLRARPSWAMT